MNTLFDVDLDACAANHAPLTPITFLDRSARVYPNRIALVHGDRRQDWAETYARCRRLGSALAGRGLERGDTVAVIAANIPELFEAHFGVPMIGAVLNAINTRLDAEAIAFILDHGEAKVLMVDPEFAPVAAEAVAMCHRPDLLIVDIEDPVQGPADPIGALTYEALLTEGDPSFAWAPPGDEWDAITLNYTSGTTGNPKGVG